MNNRQFFLSSPSLLPFNKLLQHCHLLALEYAILTVNCTKPKVSTTRAYVRTICLYSKHEFLGFNVPRGTEGEIVKQYMVSNNVDVMDIVSLSKDDWSNQSFHVCINHDYLEKFSDLWPENTF